MNYDGHVDWVATDSEHRVENHFFTFRLDAEKKTRLGNPMVAYLQKKRMSICDFSHEWPKFVEEKMFVQK